ncbi:Sjogren's syndrome/scleroderma autoantigen 1 family protein [Haloarcula salina]|uniref:Sjogren's syndrome/scleroderma autoantigen 1 family protein n=1 Tax=Haloarcula salina TaxID=1429914 RepID=UPI003C700293
MSDFDKEAEREKLREKFEKEDEKRQTTEQMSELLLKGATMTNAHCSDCGDPIFRYDGQEFCPTCQKPVAREEGASGAQADDGTADAEGADGEQGGQQRDGDHIEVADPSDDARVQFGADDDAQAADAEATPGESGDADPTATDSTPPADAAPAADQSVESPTDSGSVADTPEPNPPTDETSVPPEPEGVRGGRSGAAAGAESGTASDTTARAGSGSRPETGGRDPSVSARQHWSRAGSDDAGAELDAAATLLAQTVHRFAERAAATDNPREAREHLQAAREAAEALDAATF